nr:hypothetical protein [Mycoplasmopsis bovis]
MYKIIKKKKRTNYLCVCLIVSSSATPIKVKFNCGALEFLNKKVPHLAVGNFHMNYTKNYNHLTYDERAFIEIQIKSGYSIRFIAKKLKKKPPPKKKKKKKKKTF